MICPADVTLKGKQAHQEEINAEKGKKKHGGGGRREGDGESGGGVAENRTEKYDEV